MLINDLKNKWIDFVNKLNSKGIPVPTARDPNTGKGSLTASILVFSAGLFGICIFFMLATAVAKWAGAFTLTEATTSQVKMAADYSFQFFVTAYTGYLGRQMQKPASPKALEVQKVDSPD